MSDNSLNKKSRKGEIHIGIKEHLKEPFLEAFRELGFIHAAADRINVTTRTIYRWRESDENFRNKFHEAQQRNVERLERIAMARAMKKSDILMIFLLKALNPEKYKERYQHELDSKTIEILVTQFIGAVKKHAPDFCPHCKSHLGLPEKISKELESLSNSLAGVR